MGGEGSGALLGGPKQLSVDDAEVKAAAEFAVKQLAAQSNSLMPPTLKEVCVLSKGHRAQPAFANILFK